MYNSLTDIPGIQVGHWTNLEAGTGCTVVLCPEGAVAGVDVRGGAPGTRELALLDPVCTVEKVHAVLLAGGSAFGLAAADGVMRWLEERGHGFDTGVARVPIVPAAILFDLNLGRSDVRPNAEAGYAACMAAGGGPVAEGTVGAGTGATVGKMLGFKQATKGGLGTASKQIGKGIVVAALVAVNAVGDVIDPATGQILAGARRPLIGGFADSMKFAESSLGQILRAQSSGENTTLAVVATNVALTKSGATKVAQMAHDGLARTIRPIHTPLDGDTIFALSLGDRQGDPGLVGAVAAEVLATAVVRAIRAATGLHGIPAAQELN
ncbi:P1 family peptidase [Litorilinea aerophila]|uniref:P1 family peptidase n=1 Tax=Litorilinea aerophila TaxID=1204385 RepID=A0A540V958_9CHLR|nr:P1 family peptidase [Litorilinea aerophila]MCC9078829.1 P1 family peptidase [Litorilinea aerophila]